MELYGLAMPDIPENFRFVWDWFFELASGRSSNGFGWNAISWQEMAAWAQAVGVELRPWLCACFLAMDREWLNAARERENAKSGTKHTGGGRKPGR